MLAKMLKQIERVVDGVAIAFFAIIFVVILLQIFFRFVLRAPFTWAEELSRSLFIWVCFLGWVIAVRRGTHIRITFFLDKLPVPLKRTVMIGLQLLAIFFLAQLFRLGTILMLRNTTVPTVTLFFTWAYIYLAAPVSALLMLLYLLIDLVHLLRGKQIVQSGTNLE